jgi:hypothetical protein
VAGSRASSAMFETVSMSVYAPRGVNGAPRTPARP